MLTKGGALAGDQLVLSKPIGFGTVTTALKQGKARQADIVEAVGWMKRLNRTASEIAVEFGIKAGTDITGFSLLGHAYEMAAASKIAMHFFFEKIPFTSGAKQYAQEWIFPGGSSDNRIFYGDHVKFESDLEEHYQMLLFDAQTSGGLLLSVPSDKLNQLLERAAQLGQMFWVIGEVVEGEGILVA